ncbi:hypothetical protein FRB98_001498 [Tulasnella sp. 332]|nr:hypothetical protein FRB98_001498 [Tulasnella sp. 332]
MLSNCAIFCVLASFCTVVRSGPSVIPSVDLSDGAIFRGKLQGGLHKFLGIPFAKAPRFRQAVPRRLYPPGDYDAIKYGPGCIAMKQPALFGSGEVATVVSWITNRLNINIVRPKGVDSTQKLPVLVFIFGGGFAQGSSSTIVFHGDDFVKRSINMGMPVIYVTFDYRSNAFGFLASEEVRTAGVANLGLLDQRVALQWVQDNISKFGGDPSKVTVWGHSAGAVSIALHFVANGGDVQNLFRGAIMQSGPIPPIGDLKGGQGDYNFLVTETGCSGHADTLQCLREVPLQMLKAAIDKTRSIWGYTSLASSWLPRVDGSFITENPHDSLTSGRMANLPFIMGTTDDEGSVFAWASRNITTSAQTEQYLNQNYFPAATMEEVDKVFAFYPDAYQNSAPWFRQFKRIATFVGDVVFQAPRRQFLGSAKSNRWTYIFRRHKTFPLPDPLFGSFHGSDLLNTFYGGEIQDYYINFVNELNPNHKNRKLAWPRYHYDEAQGKPDQRSRKALDLRDPEKLSISEDNDREEEINYIQELSLKYPYER